MRSSSSRFPFFIVRLATPELVRMVMNAKRSLDINYFSTRDISTSLLGPELATGLPDSQIFINEVLSTSDQKGISITERDREEARV